MYKHKILKTRTKFIWLLWKYTSESHYYVHFKIVMGKKYLRRFMTVDHNLHPDRLESFLQHSFRWQFSSHRLTHCIVVTPSSSDISFKVYDHLRDIDTTSRGHYMELPAVPQSQVPKPWNAPSSYNTFPWISLLITAFNNHDIAIYSYKLQWEDYSRWSLPM